MASAWDAVDDTDDETNSVPSSVATIATPLRQCKDNVVKDADFHGKDNVFKDADFQGTGWWQRPLTQALASERAACGVQARPLRVGTACSGTEAPAHGLQAPRPSS